MPEYHWVGRPIPRLDAREKVTGTLKYNNDLEFPNMLFGKAVRSPYPHALIKDIDVGKAEKLKGVVKVLTYKDIPGLNGYGILIQDQPVLAEDKVRFIGEPVALVLAESQALALEGAKQVDVKYEVLPVVDDVWAAIYDLPAKVHQEGNILLHTHIKNGNPEEVWSRAAAVVENVYKTSRQLHGYLETEAGVGLVENGNITVYCGSHYPHRDLIQIARVLDLPVEKIRVNSRAVGGGFGGKDEVTLQIQLALAAWKTGCPVKIVHTREESILTSLKRHPMIVKMKTAVDGQGMLLANKVEIYADTGAYASLGGPVINLAVEHACGAYRVPNAEIDGYCVYTNNGVSGAMRGFGVNQVTLAMETQMDLLAQKVGLDRLKIRKRNALQTGDITPLGNKAIGAMGTLAALEVAENCPEWQEAETWKQQSLHLRKKRGVGVAASIQGVGLGKGLPDDAKAEIEYLADGKFRVAVGTPEVGQGNITALSQIAAEALGCDIHKIILINGDTGLAPDSGSSTASRSIYAAGNAIIDAAKKMKELLKENVKPQDYPIMAKGYFHFPVAEKGIEGAFGLPHCIFSSMVHLAMVEVDTLTGTVEVKKIVAVPDAGRVINLQGLESQCEGGALMGLGYALLENVIMQDGRMLTPNLSTYLMPSALDVPEMRTIPSESVPEPTGPFGAKGIGEAVCVPVTAAITNAIFDAIGRPVTQIPATPERIYRLLHPDLE